MFEEAKENWRLLSRIIWTRFICNTLFPFRICFTHEAMRCVTFKVILLNLRKSLPNIFKIRAKNSIALWEFLQHYKRNNFRNATSLEFHATLHVMFSRHETRRDEMISSLWRNFLTLKEPNHNAAHRNQPNRTKPNWAELSWTELNQVCYILCIVVFISYYCNVLVFQVLLLIILRGDIWIIIYWTKKLRVKDQ